MALVEVEWIDANSQRDQQDKEEALRMEMPVVFTHGVLLESSKTRVVVAGEVLLENNKPTYRNITVVPRGMVRRVRRLQGGKA